MLKTPDFRENTDRVGAATGRFGCGIRAFATMRYHLHEPGAQMTSGTTYCVRHWMQPGRDRLWQLPAFALDGRGPFAKMEKFPDVSTVKVRCWPSRHREKNSGRIECPITKGLAFDAETDLQKQECILTQGLRVRSAPV
jgi:hypothetical protein